MTWAFNQHETDLYRRMISGANRTLVVSALAFVATILIGYPFADSFCIHLLVADHIGMILLATVIKIAYVARCVAQRGLGQLVS
ncbi:hypothetical protein [Microbulbifer hainanensis]|uniref:hypothetical protein n=1 Tax=Microbulbifer hainanensis TaxID=2735675 RepID=UPI0018660DB4|nr:hypothetical protein [Microbulbifer hainanensis]